MIDQIRKSFKTARDRKWDKLYYVYDIHETILLPDYENNMPLTFYPYAKEALQLMTNHPMLVSILYTCSFPDEIERYQQFFRDNHIYFKYINSNPEVENTRFGCFNGGKMYMSCLFDDKAGFDANNSWYNIYCYFKSLKVSDQIKSLPPSTAKTILTNSHYGIFNKASETMAKAVTDIKEASKMIGEKVHRESKPWSDYLINEIDTSTRIINPEPTDMKTMNVLELLKGKTIRVKTDIGVELDIEIASVEEKKIGDKHISHFQIPEPMPGPVEYEYVVTFVNGGSKKYKRLTELEFIS